MSRKNYILKELKKTNEYRKQIFFYYLFVAYGNKKIIISQGFEHVETCEETSAFEMGLINDY